MPELYNAPGWLVSVDCSSNSSLFAHTTLLPAGLELDPSNQQLKEGLAAARAAATPPRPAASAYARAGGRLGMARAALAGAQIVMVLLAPVALQPFMRVQAWQAFFLFNRLALLAFGLKARRHA